MNMLLSLRHGNIVGQLWKCDLKKEGLLVLLSLWVSYFILTLPCLTTPLYSDNSWLACYELPCTPTQQNHKFTVLLRICLWLHEQVWNRCTVYFCRYYTCLYVFPSSNDRSKEITPVRGSNHLTMTEIQVRVSSRFKTLSKCWCTD